MSSKDNNFADKVAKLCYDHYSSLSKSGKPKKGEEWTLLSGIILKISKCDGDYDLKVLSLATGSKCIGCHFMSPNGCIVNDSHAEVLSRRCFLRYLYNQVNIIKNGGHSDLLIKKSITISENKDNKSHKNDKIDKVNNEFGINDCSDDENMSKIDNLCIEKYEVKPDVTFHLFSSHIPCGDASIIPIINAQNSFNKNCDQKISPVNCNNNNEHSTSLITCNNKNNVHQNNPCVVHCEKGKKNIGDIDASQSSHDWNLCLGDDDDNCGINYKKRKIEKIDFCNIDESSQNEYKNNSISVIIDPNVNHHEKNEISINDKILQKNCNCKSSFHNNLTSEGKRKVGCSKASFDTTNIPYKHSHNNIQFDSTYLSESVGDIITTVTFNSDCNDVNRTGAKCISNDPRQDPKCDGIYYHSIGAVRTKPGRGDPTLSVSCSDKIARWIAVGLQGALLSLLIDRPITLSSVIIGAGGPYSIESLHRAIIERTKTENRPNLLQSQYVFEMSKYSLGNLSAKRPCHTAIMWTDSINERQTEVAVQGRRLGVTKKSTDVGSLMICKKELFKLFVRVTDQKFLNKSYFSVKQLSRNYYDNWKQVKKNLGAWTEKPRNLLDFVVSESDL